MKVVAVIPIKMGSKRLPNKNLLPFGDDTLLSNICRISSKSINIHSTYVFSSSSDLQNIIPKDVKFLLRKEKFNSDDISMNEILYEFSNYIEADIYVLLHSTSPFLKSESIDKGIAYVLSDRYDSSFSVKELHEFLWNYKDPINYDLRRTPRTQDLKGYYIETSGFYVFKAEIIKKHVRRIGFNPKMVEVSEIESVDIDEQLDYDFAALIKEKYIE